MARKRCHNDGLPKWEQNPPDPRRTGFPEGEILPRPSAEWGDSIVRDTIVGCVYAYRDVILAGYQDQYAVLRFGRELRETILEAFDGYHAHQERLTRERDLKSGRPGEPPPASAERA